MRRLETLPDQVVIGLMSGTSADGIDAVAARFSVSDSGFEWDFLGRASSPYSDDMRTRVLRAMRPDSSDVLLITQLHIEIGEAYANVAQRLVDTLEIPVDLVALSGQTIYHIPRRDEEKGWLRPSTLQLGEPAVVAERLRTPVMSDFRQSDMAAGGQGAPLVPFGDLYLFGKPGAHVAVHNIGGISNLTSIDWQGAAPHVTAFDTGPGNCLIDEATEKYLGLPFDDGGRIAAAGTVDQKVLKRWLEHPYFALTPPKTTGRELFRLEDFVDEIVGLTPEDLVATLTAFTAHSIARAYREHVLPGLHSLIVAGGGARNTTLMEMIRKLVQAPVLTMEDLGLKSQDREALSFAVMGYFGFNGRPNTIASATGAGRAVTAGKLTRH